jgi:hypothetical protein
VLDGSGGAQGRQANEANSSWEDAGQAWERAALQENILKIC